MLKYYLEPVAAACALFPLIAGAVTLPFAVANYRKYGGIAVMRVMVVFSFILYCMCVYLLTVLPLPSREAVEAMERHPIGWIPFRDLYKAAKEAGLSLRNLKDGAAWKEFLTCADMFQMLANISMLMPLGFYLRYYFGLSMKKTVLIGFGASLFFEITQRTGLYGIYPKPYRFTEMDDLINNTLGTFLGYVFTPLVAYFLPSREEIDRISYQKGEHVTVVRRGFSAVSDVLLFAVLAAAAALVSFRIPWLGAVPAGIIVWFILFAIVPAATRGSTPGQALLKLRTVSEDGKTPAPLWRLAWRNFLLYGAELAAVFVCGSLIGAFAAVMMTREMSAMLKIILLDACLILPVTLFVVLLRSQGRWSALPHNRWSHTAVVAAGTAEMPAKPEKKAKAETKPKAEKAKTEKTEKKK